MKVNEIFFSIQGESSWSGLPCIFIRLTGCNLRCSYCDTTFSYEEGKEYSIEEILKNIKGFGCKLVEITGGEPLLQKDIYPLTERLCDEGYQVLVETIGSIDIGGLDERAIKIMDIKTPDSGSDMSTNWENIRKLKEIDEVKFVISSKRDYLWAKDIIEKYSLIDKVTVLISVAFGKLEPRDAVKWILEDGLKVRFQPQIHKYIWDSDTRGV